MPSSTGWRDPEGERSPEAESLGRIVAGLLGQRTFARGVPLGRLVRMWEDVVGPRLAPETAPARLQGGTLLVVAASGPWGAQARFLADMIKKRANEALGDDLIARVHVVVSPDRSDASRALRHKGFEG